MRSIVIALVSIGVVMAASRQSRGEEKAIPQGHTQSAEVTAWAILLQVQQRGDDSAPNTSPGTTRDDLSLADSALGTLAIENQKESSSSPAADRINSVLVGVRRQMAALCLRADASSGAIPTIASQEVQGNLKELQTLYKPALLAEARAMADRYRCPMHPEVIGVKNEVCPKCGMPLNVQVRLASATLLPGAEPRRVMRAQVDTDAPLQVGVRASAHLVLYWPGGEPVTPDQLSIVHTQKIHLLIIDGSFTDYHHEHPVPTNIAGRYDFAFTPHKPGTYRVWADVQPSLTGIQEYVMTVVPAATSEEVLSNTADSREANVNGLHFALQFPQAVKAGETAMGTLRVTQPDGSGFTHLEPVMDAFAHLVGFHENHTTVLHIHPEALHPPSPDDRGGPDLHFRLFAPLPGFYRLFAQVQREGVQQFASFGLSVAPGTTPWIDKEINCSSSTPRSLTGWDSFPLLLANYQSRCPRHR